MKSSRPLGLGGELAFSLLLGGLLGLWFLLEPLLRFGPNLVRMGQTVPRLVLTCMAIGGSLGLLSALFLSVFRNRWRFVQKLHLSIVSAVLAAGLIAGLLVFWALRWSVPALMGMGSKTTYAALGVASAVVVSGLGLLWASAWAERPRWARSLGPAILWGGVLLAATTLLVQGTHRRPIEIKPGDVAWKDRPIRRVYLLTIDALRADHLSCYGYPRPTTPVIDQLASEGIRYRTCYSQGNRSELSFGSLLTGLIPTAHGLSRDFGEAHPLPSEVTTLAEAMARAGYITVGLLTNPYLKRGLGLDQGFQVVDEFYYHYRKLLVFRLLEKLGLLREPDVHLATIPRGHEVTDRALELLDRYRDQPLFAFIHYMDVHHPYWPPAELVEKFHRPESSQTDPHLLFNRVTERGQRLVSPEHGPFSEEDRNRLIDLYDGVIAYADGEIGRLLEGLRARGMLENSLIVLTADHGDEFGEHGYLFHMNPVPIEPLTRVPLILWSPDLLPNPGTIDAPVAHIDLLPTYLSLLGIQEVPPVQGRPLPLIEPVQFDSLRLSISEGPGVATLRRQHQGRWWKLWWHHEESQARLFDLTADPEERFDRGGEHPELLRDLEVDLLRLLDQFKARSGRSAQPLDASTIDELKSLGYIRGAAADSSSEAKEPGKP